MDHILARQWLHCSIFDELVRVCGPISADTLRAEILRIYQFAIAEKVVRCVELGYRRILVVLPTGGGKTRLAAAMIQSALRNGKTSQFLVHRKELIDQTSVSFADLNIRHSFIASNRPPPSESDSVVLAGVQTLVRRLERYQAPDFLIIDEVHHATASSWAAVLNRYGDEGSVVVGLTATPERLDGKGLDTHFEVMVEGPSTGDLIEAGYLSPYDYYAPGVPDLSGVATVAGEFNRRDIDGIMNEPSLIGDIVAHYQRLASNQQGIIFASSVAHSKNIVASFEAAGISAAHVDGQMPDDRRKSIVDAHRRGDLLIMSNCQLFGEGFDVPAVSYVGLARPTKSLALHLQQVGRGLRISPGKSKAIICDHAGNAFRHGLPDDQREWSLQGRAGRKAATGVNDDATPVHQCEVCFRVTPSSVRVCPGCDTEFPVRTPTPPKEVSGELAKLERVERAKARKVEERMCQTYEDFVRLAVTRGYSKPQGWARVKMRLRTGGFR